MNHSKRHSYYVKKIIDYLRAEGYHAEKVEFTSFDGTRYHKKDLWGADIEYRSKLSHGLIQVKTMAKDADQLSAPQLRKARNQLLKDENWPECYKRLVCYWRPRAKKPTFYATHWLGGDAEL